MATLKQTKVGAGEPALNAVPFKDKFKERGAVWIKKAKNGKEYLSVSFDKVNYVAFANTKKTADNQPDYRIFEDLMPRAKEE